MTLHEQVVCLAQQKYPDIDAATVRVIPTLSAAVEFMDATGSETIRMDWFDASGQPMMGWGPKTNILIVHRSVIALLRADAESRETK